MTDTKRSPLSNILPPLIFGAGTFNILYNKDPYALDTKGLVLEALNQGVRAFDTSPYYGPSEELLGNALAAPSFVERYRRDEYFLLTKVGRIAEAEFDYSPEWVRKSVARSLERLKTKYLDVVYCHDVEFVTPEEVVAAVRELRRIRDEEGTINYIGISGYPVNTLCDMAQLIRDETGEPLDIVLSYANFTLQNSLLAKNGIKRLQAADIDVVANASPLGMGLLRSDPPPTGSQGDWHPAPPGLRAAVQQAAAFCGEQGERLEVIATRYSLESWLSAGRAVGSRGDPGIGVPWKRDLNGETGGRHGVSVMGFSSQSELEKAMLVWRSIFDGFENGQEVAQQAGRWKMAHEWSLNRRKAVQMMAEGVQDILGRWFDHAWSSPPPGWKTVKGTET